MRPLNAHVRRQVPRMRTRRYTPRWRRSVAADGPTTVDRGGSDCGAHSDLRRPTRDDPVAHLLPHSALVAFPGLQTLGPDFAFGRFFVTFSLSGKSTPLLTRNLAGHFLPSA